MSTVELTRSVKEVQNLIEEAQTVGQSLLEQEPTNQTDVSEFRERYLGWESRTAAMLESSFSTSGFMATSPKSEFMGTAVSLLDLKISNTTIPLARVPEVLNDVREKLRVLRSVVNRLDLYVPAHSTGPDRQVSDDAPIFLVHGHDLARREIVRRFLETVTDRTVVVLADQANAGDDLLGKLLRNAQEACFAVVLLTPDDIGGVVEGQQNRRARQNVVFELGLFIGLLGRHRVAALNDATVEIPTDFSGVAYIPIEGESWQIELTRELKAAGIRVSLDAAL